MCHRTEFKRREMAETVIALTGSKSTIEHRRLPSDDPRQRQPDISLARAKLDGNPAVTSEAGLQQTIAIFDQLLVRVR